MLCNGQLVPIDLHIYPPRRSSDLWELGVNIGHPMISGDVEPLIPSGFGAGLHLRKSLNYFFSLKLTGNYFSTKGLDARPQRLSSLVNEIGRASCRERV